MPERKKPRARLSRLPEARAATTVNPFFLGGAFLRYCVEQGWLAMEGSGHGARYLVTPEGRRSLKRRFGIEV